MQTTDIKVEFKNSLMYHSKEQAPEFISEREREREREKLLYLWQVPLLSFLAIHFKSIVS